MDMEPKEKCSTRIAKALAIRGMKQSELCEKTSIPKSAISQYVSGAFEPKQDRVFLISQALNVDPAWLMGFDVPMEKKDDQPTQIKSSPGELQLTEGERMILAVFRQIPEDQQRIFLEMGRAYANSLKKG
jgi:transcriptional regulator with XRE-family HTH domain